MPQNGVFTQNAQKVPSWSNFPPKITFLKSHNQNTYVSRLKMWFRKNIYFFAQNLISPPTDGALKVYSLHSGLDGKLNDELTRKRKKEETSQLERKNQALCDQLAVSKC
jgi:hypothetical protein